jgi:hypothetical protein
MEVAEVVELQVRAKLEYKATFPMGEASDLHTICTSMGRTYSRLLAM